MEHLPANTPHMHIFMVPTPGIMQQLVAMLVVVLVPTSGIMLQSVVMLVLLLVPNLRIMNQFVVMRLLTQGQVLLIRWVLPLLTPRLLRAQHSGLQTNHRILLWLWTVVQMWFLQQLARQQSCIRRKNGSAFPFRLPRDATAMVIGMAAFTTVEVVAKPFRAGVSGIIDVAIAAAGSAAAAAASAAANFPDAGAGATSGAVATALQNRLFHTLARCHCLRIACRQLGASRGKHL